jgi:DNA topoisomerase-2
MVNPPKELTVEQIYQKKSQLEHILLRPDTYIGSVELLQQDMWIWDFEHEKMIKKEISYVPGLFKIFDEILVNAADNKQRDKNMSVIRVNIDQDNNVIRVFNNGRGIPVVEHKEEKVLVPTLIFGHLLTSSNYNDDDKKVTGGRNGYGAKLCNIFSTKFTLETSSRSDKKSFKQTWTDNMSKAAEPIVDKNKEDDFTCVTFKPDLSKFKMSRLDDDTVALLARRAYDIAASTPGVKVFLNDKKLPISKFEDYCKLYLSSAMSQQQNNDDFGGVTEPVKLIYEKPHERWEVAIAVSDIGFQQVSFVNSISTSKGGRHVDFIVDQLVKHISEIVNKKQKNSNTVKPFQIKNHMWVFINCQIENPTFDSQTKENMTLQSKSFGSKPALTEDFYKKIAKSGLLDKIMTWLAFKDKTDLEKAGSKSKQIKLKGIPKLDDANDAGTKDSISCTLIVTEGDSAKTLAVAGLGVIGRDKYGVFPLRGKMLNVREASAKQMIENSEVSSLLKIIGLSFKEKYETKESLKLLRYGKLMIMTDQDHDGSHIKGLIINFVHHQWPNLLKHGFVEEFITPIVKVSKGNKQEKSFYSMPEFEEWQQATENWNTWKIKYYKGLGTSTSKEAKEYFSDMTRHRILFKHSNRADDLAIQLAFSKKFIEERKDWLTRFMEDRKIRRATPNSVDDYLYQKNTKHITFVDFVNKELILFSNLDNERSIPCMVDGFKPGQRKVMFACFKRNLVKELKVAQLAGSVAELSSYHHGEASLMGTIINLAQNFVGANNINLLLPIGQFGTRLHGGKDSASPRYIFTALHPLTRLLFNPKDDPLFAYINDDGQQVEPEWYCPILPVVLVNGSEGIGTGWSTKIPNFSPREIIDNLKRMIRGEQAQTMKPFYKNFRGQIDTIDDTRVITSGTVSIIGEHSVEITELPINTWTQAFKEKILEGYLHGEDKKEPVIADYREYHTDTTVRFVVKFSAEQFKSAEKMGFHKFFNLQKSISTNNMVLFDEKGCLKRYDSIQAILGEFYSVRSRFYVKRKSYMEGILGAESLKLDNIARFIIEKIENKIKVENLKKADICRMLKERKYDADPVVIWKAKITKELGYQNSDNTATHNSQEGDQEDEETPANSDKHDYDYLLSMPIWNLTMEKKDEILKQQKNKGDELKRLKAKTPDTLWLDDLDEFTLKLDEYERKEREEDSAAQLKAFKAGVAAKGASGGRKGMMGGGGGKMGKLEYQPADNGELVKPEMDKDIIGKPIARSAAVKQEASREKAPTIVDIIFKAEELNDKEIAEMLTAMAHVDKKAKHNQKEKAVAPVKKEKEPKLDAQGNPLEVKKRMKKEPTSKTNLKKAANGGDNSKDNSTLDKFFKKKQPKSDSEDNDDYEIEEIISTSNSPIEKRVISRERKAIKYSGMDIDSDADSDKDNDNMSTATTATDEAKTSNKRASKKKAVISDDDDDDAAAPVMVQNVTSQSEEDNFMPSKKKKAKTTDEEKSPKTKPKTKAKKVDSDEEDTENKPPKTAVKVASIFLKKPKVAAAATATAAAAAAVKPPAKKKPAVVDSDSDECQVVDSDGSEYTEPKPKSKKRLLTKTESQTKLAGGAKTASRSGLKTKTVNKAPLSDDDLFTAD